MGLQPSPVGLFGFYTLILYTVIINKLFKTTLPLVVRVPQSAYVFLKFCKKKLKFPVENAKIYRKKTKNFVNLIHFETFETLVNLSFEGLSFCGFKIVPRVITRKFPKIYNGFEGNKRR